MYVWLSVTELCRIRRRAKEIITCHSYLVYDYTESDNLRFIIDFYWATVFEYELNAWMRDPKTWPQTRTLEMFRQWFDIDFAPVVSDIVAGQSYSPNIYL